MARTQPNIALPLNQAMALLVQNQAAFLSNMAEVYRRFERIERDLIEIKTTLLRHEQILAALPDLIRQEVRRAIRHEMIGFKPK